jgi:hypothetical protein
MMEGSHGAARIHKNPLVSALTTDQGEDVLLDLPRLTFNIGI